MGVEDVFLGEGSQEDVAFAVAVVVIDNPDASVAVLAAIRIGDLAAFVQEQVADPGGAVIV